jgi:putative ABC transport system permease protein
MYITGILGRKMKFEFISLAFINLKQRKVRSVLTIIGIFIGIAAVVALITLSQGMQNAISEQFIGLGSDKLVVQAAGGGFGPPGTAVTVPLKKKDEKVIDSINGVELALGRLIRIVELDFKKEQKFTYAVTVPDTEEEIELVIEANDYQIEEGRFLDKKSKNLVVLGYDVAHGLFEKDIVIRENIIVQDKEFKVIGILKKSGNPQKDDSIVMPEASLREILNLGTEYDVIPVKVKTGQDVDKVSERISEELRKFRGVEEGKEDFTIQTPQQLLGALNNILMVLQGVLVGIAAISLIVGGVGIMNTMYTTVTERTKEIGIMKSVGARNLQILILFTAEAGTLGFVGGFVGVIVGLSTSKLVQILAEKTYGAVLIQVEFPIVLIIGVLIFSFVVGAISGILPAKQAAKLKPVEALRK